MEDNDFTKPTEENEAIESDNTSKAGICFCQKLYFPTTFQEDVELRTTKEFRDFEIRIQRL